MVFQNQMRHFPKTGPYFLLKTLSLLFVLCGSMIAQSAEPGREVNVAPSMPNGCTAADSDQIDIAIPGPSFRKTWFGKNCIRLLGGFSDVAGSFVGLAWSRTGLLHWGEALTIDAEYGVRLHRAAFDLVKPSLLGERIGLEISAYGERFHYDQGRESSIFAWYRDIPQFRSFPPEDIVDFVRYEAGTSIRTQYRLRPATTLSLAYSYRSTDVTPQTDATAQYFTQVTFLGGFYPKLKDIQESALIPSFAYNTVDSADRPTRGVSIAISTSVSGLGGDVNTVQPAIEVKYFHSGFRNDHVFALHFRGRLLAGYGGGDAPPYDRFYLGGEKDVRGFDGWSISPVAYLPGTAEVNVYNSDGSLRTQKGVPITMPVATFWPVSVGGDTSLVANTEYRMRISNRWTAVLFTDAGSNRVVFRDQLQPSWAYQTILDEEFPEVGFDNHVRLAPGTQKLRVSSGAELQVRIPGLNVPLRFYAGYNPRVFQGLLNTPLVAAKGYFPNSVTYENALNLLGPHPLSERSYFVRFAIGRTF